MEIRELRTEDEYRSAVPILRQLWTEIEPKEVLEWVHKDDYHLFGRLDDGEIVGVAGVLVAGLLHHTQHAWLYDLVVEESRRDEGHGTALVNFVEQWASEQGCESISLASPTEKATTHEYYSQRGYDEWGVIIEKKL